ncbi:ATP-NAD kinase-like domain-containing protein [Obelidium mucronatum]|nr:ATP-NAD kinase-like domain-containing protein [Obelidium mucronatum]
MKAWASKTSNAGISECMEALGGVGYIEETGVSTILRDQSVNMIWEGATNVMALDLLRVLSETRGDAVKIFPKVCQKRMLDLLCGPLISVSPKTVFNLETGYMLAGVILLEKASYTGEMEERMEDIAMLVICNSLHEAKAKSAIAKLKENCRLQPKVVHTRCKGDAFRLAAEAVEQQADGTNPIIVVSVGGDGTLHEIINGIMSANSSLVHQRRRVLLAVIPSGSGNALATTIGVRDMDQAAAMIVKYLQTHNATAIKPLRISSFSIANPPPKDHSVVDNSSLPLLPLEWPKPLAYTFCVVSYGLHAQIVKQSEVLRFLGNSRFTYVAWFLAHICWIFWAAVWTIDKQTRCHGDQNEFALERDDSENQLSFNGELGYSYFAATKMTHFEPGFNISPNSSPFSREIDVISTTTRSGSKLWSFLMSACFGGNPLHLPYCENIKVRGIVFQPILRGFWRFMFNPRRCSADVCVDGEMWRVPNGKAVYIKDLDDMEQIFDIIVPE